jgi:hypothetical protein
MSLRTAVQDPLSSQDYARALKNCLNIELQVSPKNIIVFLESEHVIDGLFNVSLVFLASRRIDF